MKNRTQTMNSQPSIRPGVSRALRALGGAALLGALFCAVPLRAADALIGRWIGGSTSLTNYSTYTPSGTHDGVAVGSSAGLLAWSADVPAGFAGSSLDLTANNVAVLITNTATDDLSYTNTFDEGISNRFSAAFWFKASAAGAPPLAGTWFGKSGNTPFGWKSRPLQPKADFTLRNNSGESVASSMTSSNDVNDGAWHHVACVFDGTVSFRKIYVDGVLQKQTTGTPYGVNLAPGSHLVIGANQGTAAGSAISSFFPGKMYDVRIYNYALTDVGVLQIFTPGGLASSKEITSFTFPGLGSAAIVGTNISITVPYSTVVTNLAPTYADTGVSRTPASGSTQNFSTPKIYTITAQDTSTKGYRVTVSNAPISTANSMLSLTWGAYSSSIVGTNVTLYVPPGTVVTALNPTVTVSPFATVSPLSGTTNNFTTPVNYTVTAENGIATKTYLVTVGQANLWTNSAGGVWTTATDWDPNVVPTSAATTILGFKTAGTYTSTHDLGDGFQLNQLVFGAPALTLDGQSLQFAGTAPAIVQSSAAAVTIANNLDLGTGTTIGGAGAGAVTLNGAISGGTLTKLSAGTLTISGVNSFSDATISSGTLSVAAQTALGSGTVTLAGGATMKTVNFEGFGAGGNLDNAIVLSGGLVTMDVTFSTAKDIWFAGVVSGPGGIYIQGGIRGVTLSGDNTFSGGVTVTADNRVVVTHTNGLGAGALNLVNTARAHLGYTGDHTVTSLTFGGVAQPNGTYGSTNSGADVGDNVHFVDVGTGTVTVGLHHQAKILTFVFPSLPTTTINQTNHTVSVTVPSGTDVTMLAPAYTASPAATGTPGSTATVNFTTPQSYIIRSEDGAVTNVYVVTVTVAPPVVPQPTVSGITGPVAGEFTITGSTDIAGNVVTLTSPSLSAPVTWTPIQTNAVPGGAFTFPVPQGVDPQAFYRLMGQ